MGDEFFLYKGEVAVELARSLTRVRIGPRLTEIPYAAFQHCEKLIELQLNEELQVIGDAAFYGCTSLRNVIFPSTVAELQVIGDAAFYGCTSLRNVIVPSPVIELGRQAFCGCSGLIELQLHEGLQVIGYRAFGDCTALRNVTVPSTVTEWGFDAFVNCSSLIEVQLKAGLKVIGGSAFKNCTSLRNVTVPSSVIELRNREFVNCSSLIELQLNEGLQVIGYGAFADCTALRNVTVPSTVTVLGNGAFYRCSVLTEVKLNEGLRIIGGGAFHYCTSLRNVTIPSTVIEMGLFNNCSNLSEVIFLDGERLLNQEFLDYGFRRERQGLLDQEALDEMLFDVDRDFAFLGCPLTMVKISISWAVTERMTRLPQECMLSVMQKIRGLRHLELHQDGIVLACFPVVSNTPGDETDDDSDTEAEDALEICDTNLETAKSLYQVLQLIAFHEFKESSVLIELAIWKARIDGTTAVPREDCRVAIPDPAKSLIMEYSDYAGVLKPAIEGS